MFAVNEIIKNKESGDLRIMSVAIDTVRGFKNQLESIVEYGCINLKTFVRFSCGELWLKTYKQRGEVYDMKFGTREFDWHPKKGELISVWNIEKDKQQREFFAMEGDRYLCRSNKQNNVFFSWKYAEAISCEMPSVPKKIFSVAGYEYGMGLETNETIRGRLFYFARQNWYIGYFSTESITNLTYREIKKKAEHKEGCFYFRGDPTVEEKRNDKTRYRMFINGKYYFMNTQNDIISCEVCGGDLIETYEIIKKVLK